MEWPTLAPAVLLIPTEKVDMDEPRLHVGWAMVDRHSYSHPPGQKKSTDARPPSDRPLCIPENDR